MFLTDSFVCEPEGLTTSYEQNPNLEKNSLSDDEWSLLVDMNAYLDIWRRFNIEVDVESCESSSRSFGALKNLEGQLHLFQSRKPRIKLFINTALYVIKHLIWCEFVNQPSTDLMGNRFIAMQTTSVANFVNSPSSDNKTHIRARAQCRR